MQKITPFFWFESKAEEAAAFYVSLFPNSKIIRTTRYTAESAAKTKLPAGSVMTVEFELAGQRFVAFNGGPTFRFSPATSWVINCDTQEELDHYWEKLLDGGTAMMCGWLDDRYGITWQIVPTILNHFLAQGGAVAERVTAAFLEMEKFDIAALERAAGGD